MIAAGLVVGSLVLAGCGSDKTSTPPPAGLGQGDISLKTGGAGGLGDGSGLGGSGGGSGSTGGSTDGPNGGSGPDSDVDHYREIKALKVCPMVDLKPLATALKTTITDGPEDFPPGNSLEYEGVACGGEMKGDLSQPTHVASSTFNISVVGYQSESESKAQFGNRLTKARFKGAKPASLDGDWDEGSLIVVEDQYSSLAYALVRKGTWLVKVDIQVDASGKDPESLSAAQESFRPVVTNLLTSVYTEVSSKLNG